MEYKQEQVLEQQVTGQAQTPGTTSADVLASIKLLAEMEQMFKKPEMSDNPWKQSYEAETAYLKAGQKALSQNPQLKLTFGEGFSGVQQIGLLLKKFQAEKQFKDILSSVEDELPKGPFGNVKGSNVEFTDGQDE